MPTNDSKFLFSLPPPNSLVVDMVNEWGKQHLYKSPCMTETRSARTCWGENPINLISNPTIPYCELLGADGKVQLHKLYKVGLFIELLPLDQREKFQATNLRDSY